MKWTQVFLTSSLVAAALLALTVYPWTTPIALANPKATNTTITKQELETLYQAISSVPQTPQAFVNAYMHALGTGSGLYARAFLASSIQNQLPVGRIASASYDAYWHPWLVKWSSKLVSRYLKGMNAENRLDVIAFALNPKTGTLMPVFRDRLIVTSLGVAAPLNDTPPYTITAQSVKWLHPKVWSHF